MLRVPWVPSEKQQGLDDHALCADSPQLLIAKKRIVFDSNTWWSPTSTFDWCLSPFSGPHFIALGTGTAMTIARSRRPFAVWSSGLQNFDQYRSFFLDLWASYSTSDLQIPPQIRYGLCNTGGASCLQTSLLELFHPDVLSSWSASNQMKQLVHKITCTRWDEMN